MLSAARRMQRAAAHRTTTAATTAATLPQPMASRRAAVHVHAWKDAPGGSPARRKTAQEPNRVLKASLDIILQRYYDKTPTARSVIDKVYREGYGLDQVRHDHFAFRSFGVPGLGIESLGAALEAFGYTRQDYFTFPKTHLLACWYAPPRGLYDQLPRIFVSQLQVNKLSPAAQAIIHSYTDELVNMHTSSSLSTCTPAPGAATAAAAGGGRASEAPSSSSSSSSSGGGSSSSGGAGPMLTAWTAAVTQALPWAPPSREDYLALLQESEYGAWVLVNGYALNHTALSVHSIAGWGGDIYGFANELVMKGFAMNDTGGIMKVSADSGLLQCSTVADMVDFTFADGQAHPVVGAYMEFAERKPLPQHAHLEGSGQLLEEHRRDGFETGSAANIFASTTVAAAAAQQQGVL